MLLARKQYQSHNNNQLDCFAPPFGVARNDTVSIKTRKIQVRDLEIGGGSRISVQSMCATHTQNIEATLEQIGQLQKKGADLIRVAVDNSKDVAALAEIRKNTKARLVVDLQENFPLAAEVAPHVDKIRYNPGHLHHLDKQKPIEEKVK